MGTLWAGKGRIVCIWSLWTVALSSFLVTASGAWAQDGGHKQGNSCVGHCGGDTGVCYCDDECYLYGDCCYDVCDACPGTAGCLEEGYCEGDVTTCEAVDNCDLNWTNGGDTAWFGKSDVSHDGMDAARAGCIAPTETSILETVAGQSGTMSFWWRVSCEPEYDYLASYVDYQLEDYISGETGWIYKSIHVNAGQLVSFRYYKDESVNGGEDCGWVDEVTFILDDALVISPLTKFFSTGFQGGPFTPSSKAYLLTNTGDASLVWSVSGDGTGWVDYTPAGGTLAPGTSMPLAVSLNAGAAALAAGTHTFTYTIANNDSGYSHVLQGTLSVIPIPGEITVEDTLLPAYDLDVPFGDVILGMSRTEQIIIHNTDITHSLRVDGLTLMGTPPDKSKAGAPPLASASVPPVIPKADTSRPHRPGQLIVGYSPGLKRADADGFHASMKAKRLRSFKLIDADVVQLPDNANLDKAIAAYKSMPGVAYAEPNYERHALAMPNDPQFNSLWGLNNTGQTGGTPNSDINAPEAWEFSTGSHEVIIGVIDTGVDYNHEDLAANMWVNETEYNGTPGVDDDGNGIVDDIHGARWTNGDGTATSGDPMDGQGHGTHCSGTIGAVGNNGIGVAGINWKVRIMGLKFLDDEGSGYDTDAVSALEYAIEQGAHLTSNSWGSNVYSQALADAIVAAGQANQLFIAAAGNDYGNNNDDYPMYPAAYPPDNIIAVAASDHNDNMAYFSNYGPTTVDLAAPGVNILSTVPGNGYDGTFSGTSMATPHVSGVAALLLSKNPGALYQDVKGWILDNVTPLPQWDGLTVTGGRLNATDALLYSNPHFQLDNTPALPFTIGPGGSVAFDVIYAPIAVGDHACQVRIENNDVDDPVVMVQVSGSCREDELAVSPRTDFVSEGYQFGTLTPSCMTYTLTNRGVSSISWTATAGATWLSVSATGGLLASGASVAVDVCLTAEAPTLAPDAYTSDIMFRNVTSGWQGLQKACLKVLANPGEILVEDTIPLPDDLDLPFGPLVSGNARTEQITVSNTNDDYDLLINQIGLSGSVVVNGEMAKDGTGALAVGRLNVLLLGTGTDFTLLRYYLSTFPDINRVDAYDAASGVPTAEMLADYHAVVVMSEYAFLDAAATGNALADYVDAGGSVVEAVAAFAFDSGFGLELGGRFVTDDYEPFLHGEFGYNEYLFLGAHDSRHPIMQGVSNIPGGFMVSVEMRPGAEWVASWYDGTPLVAVWNQNVVGINLYAFDYGDLSGDVALLFHNAIVYVAERPFRTGTLPELPLVLAPGSSFTFDVSFAPNAAGKYSGFVRISSNDMEAPDTHVALSGLAVGGPFALDYEGRNPARAAVSDRVEIPVLTLYSLGLVTYQWYRITPDKMLTLLPDQTDEALVFDPVEWGDAGNYQCVATDTIAGSAASPIIGLEVVEELPLSGVSALGALAAALALAGNHVLRRSRR